MKNKLRVKTVARFVVLTTPAIALTLFGIQQMLELVPTETHDPEPGTPPAIEAAMAQPQIAMIDRLLPVPNGVWRPVEIKTSRYDNVDHGAGQPDCVRNIVTVEAPDNMSSQEVDENLRAVAREAFEKGAISVMVFAFSPHTKVSANRYPVATLTFAPYGDWDRTDRIYNLEEYKTVISHSSNGIEAIPIASTKTLGVDASSDR